MDAIQYLMSQHRDVEALFARYESLAGDTEQLGELFDDIEIALVQHAVIEEMHLYPIVRDKIANGEDLAEHAIEEHTGVEETLKKMESLEASSAEFDTLMKKLMRDVRHHVHEEEEDPGLFAKLREVLSTSTLEELGRKLESSARIAPTRAHPGAPNTPPANKVVGMVAAGVDRLRDAMTGRGR